MPVTIRDRGFLALARSLRQIGKGARMTVGVHEDTGAQAHGHSELIDVAVGQEFGTAPYIRSLVDAEAGEIRAQLTAAGRAVVRGAGSVTWDKALSPLGRALVQAARQRLRSEGIGPVTGELSAGIEARITEGRG